MLVGSQPLHEKFELSRFASTVDAFKNKKHGLMIPSELCLNGESGLC
jgi:hypothetical protein